MSEHQLQIEKVSKNVLYLINRSFYHELTENLIFLSVIPKEYIRATK